MISLSMIHRGLNQLRGRKISDILRQYGNQSVIANIILDINPL